MSTTMTNGATEGLSPNRRKHIDEAIDRGRDALLSRQDTRGAWNAGTDLGPGALAMQLVVERRFGVLGDRDAREGARGLLSQQREDGSFEPHPHARRGSVSATALVCAGLGACGVSRREPAVQRAWSFVERGGGVAAVCDDFRTGDMTAVFLLLEGLVGADFLPDLPLEVALLPLERMLEGRVHPGNAMVLVTLLALRDRMRGRARGGLFGGAVRALERWRIESCLGEYQNPNGSWNSITIQTLLMLAGLWAAGFSAHDERVARALAWLAARKRHGSRGLEIEAIPNDVFTTALAVLALCEADLPRSDGRLAAAAEFLVRAQHTVPMPRPNQRRRGAPLAGGWSFQEGNSTMPDTDDTAVVLAALSAFAGERANREVFASIERGLLWLRGMQNPDGGWPCYVWGLPSKKPGPLFLAPVRVPIDDPRSASAFWLDPPAELGDPSSEGITGRVLWGLGACGLRRGDRDVARAIAFMKHQQCESGAWWGRWKTCYLPETATALVGLAAVGEDGAQPYLQRAVRWTLGCQNDDGGFGETAAAYADPSVAGRGPSMPPVTAFVLAGLTDAVAAGSPALERAARSLVDAQRSDGTWSNEGWLETFIPPEQMYTYDGPAETMPLYALARYRRALAGGGPRGRDS